MRWNMEDKGLDSLLKESYDLHFHIGPDILPRKHTVEDLVKAEEGRIKGIALKSHSFPTIALINGIEDHMGLDLVGSVTLNYFMGGFNESAIYASSVMSRDLPIIVWFPTVHAENHLIQNKSDYEIPPEWVKDPSFKPRPKTDLKAIKVTNWAGKLIRKANNCLNTMAENECILATGHVSWREAERLAEEALDRGITTIITHPMQRDIAMPLEKQVELAGKGAYIEYCYIMYLDRDNPGDYPVEEQVNAVEEIGTDNVVLTSDAGQNKNPGASQSMRDFVKLLGDKGLGEKDFRRMIVENPRKILGL
ncbi:MAG: hypothetical protein GF416_03940 [Candidatus Altiarchaeales archaeon]|nr:hypothetical protein [Candidatus Altiarchaeales archaeon]MBD3416270.1 hypothetical protein [Candidatus Altiarchaeales archaeon]